VETSGLRVRGVGALHGWDGVASASHNGLNAETADSTVIYAKRRRAKDHSGMDVVTLLLHNCNGTDWKAGDLNIVKNLEYLPWSPSGAPSGMKITLKNNTKYLVDFGELEGQIAC
jgi:hypothetical protein